MRDSNRTIIAAAGLLLIVIGLTVHPSDGDKPNPACGDNQTCHCADK